MSSAIEAKILDTFDLKPYRRSKEDVQQYRARLCESVSEHVQKEQKESEDGKTSESWDGLDEAVQDWVNFGIDVMSGDVEETEIPQFPDWVEPEPEETKQKAKGKAKASAKKGKKVSKPSAVFRLKEIMLKQPGISRDDLDTKLKKEGFEITQSTLQSFYNDFRQTIKVLVKANLMSE